MNKHLTIKDHREESRLLSRRSLIALIAVIVLASALFFRLAYLQVIHHKMYSTLSQQNLLVVLPIEPNRGKIYDRNGVQLATNIAVFNLEVIPARTKHLPKMINALQTLLNISDTDIHNFKRSLKQHHRYEAIPLKMNLNEEEMAKFYVNRFRFPGAIIKTQRFRTYPLATPLGSVVGYVGRINSKEMSKVDPINYSGNNYIGKTGIEKYYEKILHGKVGVNEVEINASSNIVRTIKQIKPTPGNNLFLSIDSRLQAFAYKALGKNNGAIVAIQPSTGQILALVTKPSFDPNLFINGIRQKDYQQLMRSPDHPLFNRAIRGQYAPASTIKPFLAITGLETKTIDTSSKVFDPGWFRLPNTKHIYHDWKYYGHGWVNITKAIIVSCDIFFYHLAVELGMKSMDQMLSQFGYGQLTHIDMPDELPGLLPTPEWKKKTFIHSWYTGDTVLTGIGQGFVLATPIQIAVATSILAEHGARYQPYLLLKTQTPDNVIHKISPIEKPPLVLANPKIWGIVSHAMQGVITNPIGTAIHYGRNPSYTIAAKTGTAQVYGKQRDEVRSRMNIPKRLRNHHLFITFAPVKNPQIVLTIVIEHASGADRIARRINDYYFQHCAQQDKVKQYEQPS